MRLVVTTMAVTMMLATVGLGCASDGTARPVPGDAAPSDAAAKDGLLLSECKYLGEPNGLPRYDCECAEPMTLLVTYAKDASGRCIEFGDSCQPDDVTRVLLKKDCLR